MKLTTGVALEGDLPTEQTQQFSMAINAKSFEILFKKLYTDPVLAVLREIVCNAWDSHVAAGTNRPVRVQLPMALDPQLIVRDFGTGLTHEQVMHLYTTVFASTKDNDAAQTGGFGLGSKSPFAYTESFTVKRYDGQQVSIYFAGMDSGIPKITLVHQEDSAEPRGLEIIVPIRTSDCARFTNARERVFDAMPEGAIEADGQIWRRAERVAPFGELELGDIIEAISDGPVQLPLQTLSPRPSRDYVSQNFRFSQAELEWVFNRVKLYGPSQGGGYGSMAINRVQYKLNGSGFHYTPWTIEFASDVFVPAASREDLDDHHIVAEISGRKITASALFALIKDYVMLCRSGIHRKVETALAEGDPKKLAYWSDMYKRSSTVYYQQIFSSPLMRTYEQMKQTQKWLLAPDYVPEPPYVRGQLQPPKKGNRQAKIDHARLAIAGYKASWTDDIASDTWSNGWYFPSSYTWKGPKAAIPLPGIGFITPDAKDRWEKLGVTIDILDVASIELPKTQRTSNPTPKAKTPTQIAYRQWAMGYGDGSQKRSNTADFVRPLDASRTVLWVPPPSKPPAWAEKGQDWTLDDMESNKSYRYELHCQIEANDGSVQKISARSLCQAVDATKHELVVVGTQGMKRAEEQGIVFDRKFFADVIDRLRHAAKVNQLINQLPVWLRRAFVLESPTEIAGAGFDYTTLNHFQQNYLALDPLEDLSDEETLKMRTKLTREANNKDFETILRSLHQDPAIGDMLIAAVKPQYLNIFKEK